MNPTQGAALAVDCVDAVDRERVRRLQLARDLEILSEPVPALWEGALVRADLNDHPVYDTLFVELAERLRLPLNTYDTGLLRRFPAAARPPGELLDLAQLLLDLDGIGRRWRPT